MTWLRDNNTHINKTKESGVSQVDEVVMRLIPMDEAPRDGTQIIVNTKCADEGNKYYLCKWIKPYSTQSNCGAWNYIEGGYSMHIKEYKALGWMPEPKHA